MQGVVELRRRNISEPVLFLLDTGADTNCLHSKDALNLRIPRERLDNLKRGCHHYFSDEDRIVGYDIAIGITSSATGGLPASLGRDVFDNWHIECEQRRGMLHFCSSSSLVRADIANRYSLLATSNHSHSTPMTGCGGFGVHSRGPHDGHRHSS